MEEAQALQLRPKPIRDEAYILVRHTRLHLLGVSLIGLAIVFGERHGFHSLQFVLNYSPTSPWETLCVLRSQVHWASGDQNCEPASRLEDNLDIEMDRIVELSSV